MAEEEPATPTLNSNDVLMDYLIKFREDMTKRFDKIEGIPDRVTEVEEKVEEMGTELAYVKRELDRYRRQNNIIVHGIEEKARETWETRKLALLKMVSEKMGINDYFFVNGSHRLGKWDRNQKQPRPILFQMGVLEQKKLLLANGSSLRRTGFSISDDIHPDERRARFHLRQKASKMFTAEEALRCRYQVDTVKGQGTIFKQGTPHHFRLDRDNDWALVEPNTPMEQ